MRFLLIAVVEGCCGELGGLGFGESAHRDLTGTSFSYTDES